MTQGQESKPTVTPIRQLSVVLPAFNEEANIEQVVRRVTDYAEQRRLDYEVIVVNDGSKDRTEELLNSLQTEQPRLRVQHHSQNRGYGAALRTGFTAATMPYVFYMDGDGQFDIADLDHLLPIASEECIVTGYRIERRDPFVRRLNAHLFGGFLVRVALGVHVRDLNCAFKLIPKKVLDTVNLESTGALINAELYGRAIRRGFTIREVGVHHCPREAGVQTGAHLGVIFRAFYDLFCLRQKIVSGK